MASDIFIKIDGIDGQSNDKGHSKWIEVLSFSLGSVQPIVAGRATDTAGRGTFEPFIFVHELDKASPKIQLFCMNGQKIPKVQFQVCRAVAGTQVVVYEVTMENVKIGRAFIHADPVSQTEIQSPALPMETVELVAGKITWKYTAIKPDNTKDGAVEASFNQIENC